ncbi:MAG: phosphate ABC transporter permease subunit PstC [Arenicella sp.]
MTTYTFLAVFLLLAFASYHFGRSRSIRLAKDVGGIRKLAALPNYYGMLSVLWAVIPSLVLLALWTMFDEAFFNRAALALLPESTAQMSTEELSLLMNKISIAAKEGVGAKDLPAEFLPAFNKYQSLFQQYNSLKPFLVLLLLVVGALFSWRFISAKYNARVSVERITNILLLISSCIAILTTVGIVFSVLFESFRFFQKIPLTEFLFGTHWNPQIAIRADQVAADGSFGAIPLFTGTLLISAIALIIAVPVGLMSAIYLSEYASKSVRGWVKPILEILAGVPTVVYGFFAALTVAPFIRNLGESIGLNVASESALAAGLVMGIMIIPFVSSLSDDVINAVPQSLRDGSYGLGATQSETIRKVIFPAALPGIVGGILLAASRAIGETMIVVMAAGLAANLTANPLETVTTVTVQIVTLLVGDQEFDSAKTLAAFALGLLLFLVTLGLNFIALHVVKKYREQYD